MFKLLLVTVLLGLAAAENLDKNAEIISQDNQPAAADGQFGFSFGTSNGIAVQESGNADAVSGGVQWIDDNGNPIKLTYTADENGYHPSGEHLPTPPPIPEAIVKALEYIRSHPPAPEN